MPSEQNKSPPRHTPGDWRSHGLFVTTTVCSNSGELINRRDICRANSEDDAHLIAAAPDYDTAGEKALDALRRCWEVFKMEDADTSISLQVGMAITALEAALKKARGLS